MRLIITGATGFIGKYLVAGSETKFEIVCLTRRDINHENIKIHYVKTDYSVSSLSAILKQGDVIVHLAGLRLTKDNLNPTLMDFAEINIQLTENLLISAGESGVKQVVLSSTIGVYSERNEKPYSEDKVTQPNTVYGLSKLMGEQLVKYYCAKYQMTSTILRLSQCFGVGEKDTPVLMKFIKLARTKQTLSAQDNEFYLDEVYVKDVIDAMMCVIEKNSEGTFNIGGSRAYSILEMAKTVNGVFENSNLEVIKSDNRDNQDNYLSVDKAKKDLDWSPKYNLEQALQDMKKIYETN